MNKQEFQQNIKDMKPTNYINSINSINSITIYEAYNEGFEEAKQNVLFGSDFLDEPKKPVLTEEEAKWIEGLKDEQTRRPFWTKYSMLYFVTRAGFGYGFSYDSDREDREVELKHYSHEIHAEKERLTNAILYGYEVEKEKLYTVELPNQNAGGNVVLCKASDGRVYIAFTNAGRWRGVKNVQLTESEIKEDFEWAWQFAKEVE